MIQPVIQTESLTRFFGSKCAVNDLTLEVPAGCVMGLLGRNGSGKTTAIRMMLGLLRPTRGRSNIFGADSTALDPATRGRIGYMSEGHPLVGWMRVSDCASFERPGHARWNERLFRDVIDHFGLSESARARSLSRGERAGVRLALTLAQQPELLVLDDPALGLDPVARRALLEAMVYFTRTQGRTILFSSHLLADVERVADRIAVLDRGVLRACCSMDSFREAVQRVVLRFDGPAPSAETLPRVVSALRHDSELVVTVVHPDERFDEAVQALGPVEREHTPISLEDAFIDYVGRRGDRAFFNPSQGDA